MGFIRANMLPILKEHRERPFSGHLLLLGQGDIYFTYEHLERMAAVANVRLKDGVERTPSYISTFAEKGYISATTVFKSLGFKEITVLDYSTFEGASFQHDLNDNNVPSEYLQKFDTVIDHGTLEHVFHMPNALDCIFKMLKVGGRVIHSAPTNNFLDHGFYQFQPTLYHDYYLTNQWELNTFVVYQMTPNQEVEFPFFAEYEPTMFQSLSYGKMDSKMYGTVMMATKNKNSTSGKIPIQYIYAQTAGWKPADSAAAASKKKKWF